MRQSAAHCTRHHERRVIIRRSGGGGGGGLSSVEARKVGSEAASVGERTDIDWRGAGA